MKNKRRFRETVGFIQPHHTWLLLLTSLDPCVSHSTNSKSGTSGANIYDIKPTPDCPLVHG